MMKRKMEKSVRQGIYDFLAYYVSFENPLMLRIFEKEVEQKQGRSTTVGTREYLLEKAKNEGIMLERSKAEKLLAEERKKVLETKYEVVSNLILADRFTTEEIAEYASVAENFVQKVRADLAKKKN